LGLDIERIKDPDTCYDSILNCYRHYLLEKLSLQDKLKNPAACSSNRRKRLEKLENELIPQIEELVKEKNEEVCVAIVRYRKWGEHSDLLPEWISKKQKRLGNNRDSKETS